MPEPRRASIRSPRPCGCRATWDRRRAAATSGRSAPTRAPLRRSAARTSTPSRSPRTERPRRRKCSPHPARRAALRGRCPRTAQVRSAPKSRGSLALRPADAVEVFQPDPHLAPFRAALRVEYSRIRQLIDHARRPPVTDAQTALQERRRSTLVLNAQLRRLAEERIARTDVGSALVSAALERRPQLGLAG